jgi:hypothetical protein
MPSNLVKLHCIVIKVEENRDEALLWSSQGESTDTRGVINFLFKRWIIWKLFNADELWTAGEDRGELIAHIPYWTPLLILKEVRDGYLNNKRFRH